jgi:hypothetical protein
MIHLRSPAALAAVMTMLASSPAFADPASAPAPGRGALPAPRALSSEEMAALSGGDSVSVEVSTRQQLTGTTTGNTITAGTLTSGPVTFSQDSLSGFNGIGNFVVNTGANNTLQGAINISVVSTPTP